VLLTVSIVGCGGGKESAPAGPILLKGAGATAPNLVYSKWSDAYKATDAAVQLEYAATGSGDGLKQLEAGTVDFAASDMPLDDAQLAKFKVRPLHFPTLITAIVPVYNLPGVTKLQFTPEVLAGIFSGKIKTWNDPALAKLNPGVSLPSAKIVVVHRGDSSGSTFTFTSYLSKVSEEWKKNVGQGAVVKFPAGGEVIGNEAMAEMVKKTPNAIGYVESNYAIAQQLSTGSVRNAAGKFQSATLESLGAALEVAQEMEKDFRGLLINAPGENAYPICTLTWLIVPGEFADNAKGKAMKRFLRWVYGDGQKIAMPMDYGILQPPLLNRVQDQIEAIRVAP
jgi:phosphate transport system substrate-binding protein